MCDTTPSRCLWLHFLVQAIHNLADLTEVPASKADTTQALPITPSTTEPNPATPSPTDAAPSTPSTTEATPSTPSTTETAARKGASHAGKVGSLLVLVTFAAIAFGMVPFVRWLTEGDEVEVIAWSLTTVVVVGAAGFILRGIGELYASPALKASGYFLNAWTWASTALLATLQGIPFLLEELGQ